LAVVKLKETGQTIDLRHDNRIGELLEEYEDATVVYLEAKRVRDELHAEIVAKMDGAEVGLVNGWRLKMSWVNRKEFVVPAKMFQVLRLKRRWPRKREACVGDK
jgi:hypothetical protein